HRRNDLASRVLHGEKHAAEEPPEAPAGNQRARQDRGSKPNTPTYIPRHGHVGPDLGGDRDILPPHPEVERERPRRRGGDTQRRGHPDARPEYRPRDPGWQRRRWRRRRGLGGWRRWEGRSRRRRRWRRLGGRGGDGRLLLRRKRRRDVD